MPRNRRTFLKFMLAGSVTTFGLGSYWLATSQRRAARWFRALAADTRRSIRPAPQKPTPESWSDNQITISWLGHATTLINFYGINILTDPALGNRVGVSVGVGTAGPKRFVAPALRIAELPRIDVVLLSHAHMDHMDLPTLRRLGRETFTVTAKETQDVLQSTRLRRVTELGWNEHATFRSPQGELEIEAVEVEHWGQRWPSEMERGYNGYILRREGRTLLFGGDTANTPLFAELRSRGPFAAAIMPIGAYDPWVWNHCTPEQAVKMCNAARASYIVPMHHQTFKLSEEPINEPIERLSAALAREPERLALRNIGERFICPDA